MGSVIQIHPRKMLWGSPSEGTGTPNISLASLSNSLIPEIIPAWQRLSNKTYFAVIFTNSTAIGAQGTCTKATPQPKKPRKRHGLLRADRNAEPSLKELLPSPELGSPCAHPSDGKEDGAIGKVSFKNPCKPVVYGMMRFPDNDCKENWVYQLKNHK